MYRAFSPERVRHRQVVSRGHWDFSCISSASWNQENGTTLWMEPSHTLEADRLG